MAALPERSPTRDAIYAAYEVQAESGFRPHLGASLIGHSCSRALWYTFRHCTRASFPGRVLRLFETGQREEARVVANLRSTGATVLDCDPETGRQWVLSTLNGHFGGSMDAVGYGFLEAPLTWHNCEFKTHGVKSFASLKKDGVQKSKPLHYCQMQIYMELSELDRALYVGVCKDTDEIYIERIKVDHAFAKALIAKAERIINANEPPDGISKNADWYQCKWCDHHGICHEGKLPERNCRTCLSSTPVEDGKWSCARFGECRKECDAHLFIPALVAGEQVDADDNDAWIEYKMADGSVWRDGIKDGMFVCPMCGAEGATANGCRICGSGPEG